MNLFRSLSRTIVVGFLLFGMVLIGLSLLLSMELNKIHQQALAEHHFVGLLNTALEIRRFEKNYILFKDRSDFDNALGYVEQMERMLHEYRDSFRHREDGEQLLRQLTDLLNQYREAFLAYPVASRSGHSEAEEMALHKLTAQLIKSSESAAADNQNRIATTLNNSREAILYFDLLLILLLIGSGILLYRRTIHPLGRLHEELTRILEGRRAPLAEDEEDHDFAVLTRLLNLTLKNIFFRHDERLSLHYAGMNEAVLLRLVKTLAQPMTNISTTCQIILDEDEAITPPFRKEMIVQIQQQSEQCSRMVTSIQEYALHRDHDRQPIALADLLSRVVAQVRQDEPAIHQPEVDLPQDAQVTGNPFILERLLGDVLWHAIQTAPSLTHLTIRGRRLQADEIRGQLNKTTFRPLVWLDQSCPEIMELAIPLAGEDEFGDPENGLADVSSLCTVREDGRLGLCMLPTYLRQLESAFLVDRQIDGTLLIRIWLPVGPGMTTAVPMAVGAG